jgi:hypothetical protein
MASGKGVNPTVRRIATKTRFPEALKVVSSSSNWMNGDLLAWDATNKIINSAFSLTDNGAQILGVAVQSVTSGVVNDPYQGLTDVTPAASAIAGPEYGDVVQLIGKSGDTFTPGCYVYPDYTGSLTNQVSSTSGSLHAIGIYQGAQVTTGASQYIEVLMGCRFPNDVLEF